jgi:hypothetical protein
MVGVIKEVVLNNLLFILTVIPFVPPKAHVIPGGSETILTFSLLDAISLEEILFKTKKTFNKLHNRYTIL